MSDDQKVPMHLKHKPIYVINSYRAIDGRYRNNTDVVGLSLGRAQWANDGEFVPGVKVWRHVKNRWSRQSEETTLTRALDLASLVIQVIGKELYCLDLEEEVSMFGELEIEYVGNPDSREELNQYLRSRQGDIEAHIAYLKKAIGRLEKEGKKK